MTPLGLALALLLSSATPESLDPEAYRARLLSIERHLLAQERTQAAKEAQVLLAERVQWGPEALPVDRSVLEPITQVNREGVVAPLQALLRALSSAPSTLPETSVDRAALASLTRQGRGTAELLPSPLVPLPFSEKLSGWLTAAKDWVKQRLREAWQWLKRWLKKWFVPERAKEVGGVSPVLVRAVEVGVGLILAGVLLAGLLTERRRRSLPPPVAVAPVKDVDADPLSRSANEWVERAQALALDGRHREAIRAWYHALLVACYRTGLLHHQPGLTNWEYARALGAEVPWRARFSELTGRFDLEWYGRAQSSPEALDTFAGEAGVILSALGGVPA